MSPHNVVKPFRRAGIAQQIVAALFANRAILLTDGGHFARDTIFDQSQAGPVMRFLQPSHIGADAGDAGFSAPVSLADLGILGRRRGRAVPNSLRIIPLPALIALQGQGVIAALLNHLRRHLTLAAPGVSGNHLAPQSQHFQQLGQRRNLVGFGVRGQYAFAAFGKLPHKADEPLLESGGVKHTRQSGTCIVAGDAVAQFQEGLLQEFPFGVAEKFHIGAGLAAAEHGAKGDYQDVVEGIAAGVAGAGVFQGAEQVG